MIHRALAFNVKKLERTSACEPKLSIGRIYELRRRSPEGKHRKQQKKIKSDTNPRRQKARTRRAFCFYGALDRIRTCDRSVRSRVLYPAELRVQIVFLDQITTG